MQLKKTFLFIIIAITFNACFLFKKTTNNSTDELAVINLDTIETFGDGDAEALKQSEYRAAATRKNDIIHTKLDVSFDWSKQYLYGKATITAKPYFYPTSTLELDARGMEIISVKKRLIREPNPTEDQRTSEVILPPLEKLNYKYENDILAIELNKEYKKDEEYTVFIDYITKPNELKKGGGSAAINDDKGLYFINPDGKDKDKPKQIWTQGETQSNSVWFPTIDRPNERITQEINITVDKKYVTLSNGELVFSIDNADSTRTDCWKMDLPHPPYLAMMAIGEFAIVKDKWRGKEVSYYVEKEYEPYAKAIFGNTPEMLEFYSNKLGVEYAWNKYSQIVVRDYVSGAMENTTATLHGEFLQRTDRELVDRTNEDVIAHELFHQWFGDLVTCESWSNIPLNESFATYAEYLWEEYKYGKDAADLHSAQSRAGYMSEASRKQVNLIRFNYSDREDMFDAHSYNKGGQVLHMLRKYVGDAAFFASLKLYLETNKFKAVEIHNLRLAFEEVTGEDLNWFFNQWFLSSGHPELTIINDYDATTKKQKVRIIQEQVTKGNESTDQIQDLNKTHLFKTPMYIDIYANGEVKREKVVVTKKDQTFEFDAAVKPNLVNVDAEKMLLCVKNEKKPIAEWAFQYKNAPLYLDRFEALSELMKHASDSVATQVILSALHDKFWSIREDALDVLKEIQPGHETEIKATVIQMAKTDKKSDVRAASIKYLAATYEGEDMMALYKNALNDQSYAVLGAALSAVSKANPQTGITLAKQYENEKNNAILYVISDLYSTHGTDSNNDFFIHVADKFKGLNKVGFITQYLAFLKKDKKYETVNAGVTVFEGIAKDSTTTKWVSYYAKKSIKDIAAVYTEKSMLLEEKLKTLKQTNPNAGGTQELETQLAASKAQAEKLNEIYNTIK